MGKYRFKAKKENIKAEDFLNALADEECVEVYLQDCVIEGEVNIAKAGIELNENGKEPVNKALFCEGCTFTKSVRFSGTQFRGDVSFRLTHFCENVSFTNTQFCGIAGFMSTQFHSKVNFEFAQFSKDADFIGTQFCKTVSFSNAQYCEDVCFDKAQFVEAVWFHSTKFYQPPTFNDVQYYPDTLAQYWYGQFSRFVFWKPKGHQTQFYLDIQNISEGMNPFFKRYVADQQYIRAFKKEYPVLAGIWRWSSDYGRSLGLWSFWLVLFALFFGFLYSDIPCPSWLENTFIGKFFIWANPEISINSPTPNNWYTPFYFSIVTFTTLGFGDVQPANGSGQFWITLEVILGYVMLGGLISIFANKLARRS